MIYFFQYTNFCVPAGEFYNFQQLKKLLFYDPSSALYDVQNE